MNILIAGDFHYNKERFLAVSKASSLHDCLCLTGDFLDERLGNREEQIEWVSRWVRSIAKPVFFCSGNHDLDDQSNCEWISHLASSQTFIDNQITILNGKRFGVVPYIGADFSHFTDCDILVTHVPPAKTATAWCAKRKDMGDRELYHAIVSNMLSPQYIFSGHVHYPLATTAKVSETTIYNPGCQEDFSIKKV